jgi:hypothetical protein
VPSNELICLVAINENSWLWHRRLGHANMDLFSKLSKLDLVKGLPITKFVKDKICDACQLGKQTKSSFKKKESYFYNEKYITHTRKEDTNWKNKKSTCQF